MAHLLPEDLHVFERGWLSSNNIFFDDGSSSCLIDSGYTTHSDQTLDLVAARLGSRNLDRLVNTHLHSDHCGGNAVLQAKYPAMLTLIPPGQAHFIKNWDAKSLTYDATGQQCPPFNYTDVLVPGSQIRLGRQMWDIYAAPGHDPDAVLLFEPTQGILISGDALWEKGFGVVFPELDGEEAFEQVAATLDLIKTLAPTIVIPGHGRVFNYSLQSMTYAKQRLEAFIQDPVKHARHAVKVLLKFKLLEVQQQRVELFNQWARETPYLSMCKDRFFEKSDFLTFIRQMCDELVTSNAASITDGVIYNR